MPAQGFGSGATGGEGFSVVNVTNLNNSGAGSLREACASGNRIIRFTVAGTIQADDNIEVLGDNVTIDGSTAPAGGICVKGSSLNIRSSNIIVQYLRFRPGDGPGESPTNRSCIRMSNPSVTLTDIWVHHCSLTWSIDENLTLWQAIQNATFDHCIIAEALDDSLHTGPHSKAVMIGTRDDGPPPPPGTGTFNISFHHNILAHNVGRNPRIKGGDGVIDIRNNIIYNPGGIPSVAASEATQVVGTPKINWIGNFMVLKAPVPGADFYDAGAGVSGYARDNWISVIGGSSTEQPELGSTEFTVPPTTTHTANQLTGIILDDVGATLPRRDSVDQRIIDDFNAGTGDFIDSQTEVGGYPDLTVETTPVAAFSGAPTSGVVPLTVNFTDESTGGPTSWLWDFGDTETSTSQNPSHEYATPGTYTVKLTVTNASGSDQLIKTDYIMVTASPSSGSHTVRQDETIIRADSSGGEITILLPPLQQIEPGRVLIIKDVGGAAAANNITIGRNGQDIEGVSADLVMSTNNEVVRLFADTALDWWKW